MQAVVSTKNDANRNRTEPRHDVHARLGQRLCPSPSGPKAANPDEYDYDENNNVIHERKRDGRSVSFDYDPNNRLILKALSAMT